MNLLPAENDLERQLGATTDGSAKVAAAVTAGTDKTATATTTAAAVNDRR